jgi:peptide/nickel transport system substrate-binding protein
VKLLLRWYWLVTVFLKKHFLGVFIGIAIGVFLFLELPKVIALLPIKNTIHVGRVGIITVRQLPLDIQVKIGRGLTTVSSDGSVELDIAQTVSISDDGKTYVFTLKPDVFWSNGERLRSTDIDLNIPDVSVSYPTDESIVFTLQEEFSPFMSILSQPILKRSTFGRLVKKTRIIGTNPYQVTELTLRQQNITSLTLTNQEETIIYHFYPTENDALLAFKTGIIDRIEQLSSPALANWPNVKLETDKNPHRYLAIFYNTANPSLQEKSLRQLLTYAIPKTTTEDRVMSPIARTSWVYNPQVKPYVYNQETARSTLARLKEANPAYTVSLELTTTPAYAFTGEQIVQSWQELGLEASLRVVPFPDMNDYQALLIGQQTPPDPDQYTLWHSTQNTNITKYQSPKIDKLLEDGRRERHPEKRKSIYHDFQRFLVEDCPAGFLELLPTYTVSRK